MGSTENRMPTVPPITIDQTLIGSRAAKPWLSACATADQVCAAGAGNCLPPRAAAFGTNTAKETTVTSADKDSRELGDELFARVGAEQVTALEIGKQIGRRDGC